MNNLVFMCPVLIKAKHVTILNYPLVYYSCSCCWWICPVLLGDYEMKIAVLNESVSLVWHETFLFTWFFFFYWSKNWFKHIWLKIRLDTKLILQTSQVQKKIVENILVKKAFSVSSILRPWEGFVHSIIFLGGWRGINILYVWVVPE